MIGIRNKERKRPINFCGHVAFHEDFKSFHERWEDILRETFGFEGVEKPFDNACFLISYKSKVIMYIPYAFAVVSWS